MSKTWSFYSVYWIKLYDGDEHFPLFHETFIDHLKRLHEFEAMFLFFEEQWIGLIFEYWRIALLFIHEKKEQYVKTTSLTACLTSFASACWYLSFVQKYQENPIRGRNQICPSATKRL